MLFFVFSINAMEMTEHQGQIQCLNLEPHAFAKVVKENIDLLKSKDIAIDFINLRDEYGKTILRNAISLQKHEHIKIICSLNADPFVEDENGEHAVHDTAKIGDLKTLRLLIRLHKNDIRWAAMRVDHNEGKPNSPLL